MGTLLLKAWRVVGNVRSLGESSLSAQSFRMLRDVHFPCTPDSESIRLEDTSHEINYSEILSEDRLLWAIEFQTQLNGRSLREYRAAGCCPFSRAAWIGVMFRSLGGWSELLLFLMRVKSLMNHPGRSSTKAL